MSVIAETDIYDVLSFTRRHNEANGEANNDGAVENYSVTDEKINQIRARVRRAMLATVLCAHGTPMLLAGKQQRVLPR